MSFALTHEQQALLDWIKAPATAIRTKSRTEEWSDAIPDAQSPRHAILEARAGSGKTTTLLAAAQQIIRDDPHATVLVVAFNKSIADEIMGKARKAGLYKPRFNVQTLHACGNSARMSLSEYRMSNLNQHKVSDLVGEHINNLRRRSAGGNMAGLGLNASEYAPPRALPPAEDPVFVEKNKTVIESLIDFGRLYGVGIAFQLEDMHTWDLIIQRHVTLPRSYTATKARVSLVPDLLYHACELIKRCETKASDEHDFIDMLWLPVLSGATFKQYSWVLVDEAQDTNAVSRAICLASMAEHGRMIVVGDPHQCINGFQGADDNGIEVMRQALNAATFPLTISQRCGKLITAHARDNTACHDIRSRDDAPDGTIARHASAAFDHGALKELPTDGPHERAVLCRNNAPLLSLGFTLMRLEIPFRIAGGADLYARLLRLAGRWKVGDAYALLARLAVYRENEISRLRAVSASGARIDAVCDEVDMLVTIIHEVIRVNEPYVSHVTQMHVTQKIAALRAEQETAGNKGILLSTIHKAKGREWNTVYILGADRLMPSQYAVTRFDQQQEDHIRYVAITRARSALVYLDFDIEEAAETIARDADDNTIDEPDQDPHNGREIDDFDTATDNT
jgi:superfamily I DNA/RNA helicase